MVTKHSISELRPHIGQSLPGGRGSVSPGCLITKLAILFAFAALSFGQTVKTNEAAPDTLITLQRGACEARCAVYRLVIFADGTVIYQGQFYVRQAGLVKSSISPEVLAKLIGDLETGGFFQMENNYGYGGNTGCDSIDEGGPIAILSVSNQGRSKTILHDHSCVGAVPKRLTELEDKVDRAVGAVKWIK
jgi:hypothetical protein